MNLESINHTNLSPAGQALIRTSSTTDGGLFSERWWATYRLPRNLAGVSATTEPGLFISTISQLFFRGRSMGWSPTLFHELQLVP